MPLSFSFTLSFPRPHPPPPPNTHKSQFAQLATQIYITNNRPNVSGLVLSGSADFKTELSQSDMFDPRLQAIVLGVVDVSYGEYMPCIFSLTGGGGGGHMATS
jgi:hypothetical protein